MAVDAGKSFLPLVAAPGPGAKGIPDAPIENQVHCSLVQLNALQFGAMKCSACWYSEVQRSLVQCSTVKFSTVTILHCMGQC